MTSLPTGCNVGFSWKAKAWTGPTVHFNVPSVSKMHQDERFAHPHNSSVWVRMLLSTQGKSQQMFSGRGVFYSVGNLCLTEEEHPDTKWSPYSASVPHTSGISIKRQPFDQNQDLPNGLQHKPSPTLSTLRHKCVSATMSLTHVLHNILIVFYIMLHIIWHTYMIDLKSLGSVSKPQNYD